MFKSPGANSLIALCLASSVAMAMGRIHLRVQTTLVGYGIAELKEQESKLLEERAHLKMQLSKLTTKKHLILMTNALDNADNARQSMASK